MLILIVFAFISGVTTVLAPCIWPLLPIILSSSISSKNHRRPLGVAMGILISFMVFTLSISWFVRVFHFDPYLLRIFAACVLTFLGFLILIPPLLKKVDHLTIEIADYRKKKRFRPYSEFGSGLLNGVLLGVMWSPFAGPILSSITSITTSDVTFAILLLVTAYVLGIGFPLFLIAYGGQTILTRTKFLSKQTRKIQQISGIFMLLLALSILTNLDLFVESRVFTAFPNMNPTVGEKLSARLDKNIDLHLVRTLYISSRESRYFYPTGFLKRGRQWFTLIKHPVLNFFSLGRLWTINTGYTVSGWNAQILYHFYGDKVGIIINPGNNKQVTIKVLIDGKVPDLSNAGSDVQNGVVIANSYRAYQIVDFKEHPGDHTVQIEIIQQGAEVYSLTTE